MTRDIYNAIFRLFYECDYRLTINVGGIELKLYNPLLDDNEDSIWNMGVIANGTVYKMEHLYNEGKGPGTYAELFRGDYDIIRGFADCIYEDIQKYLSIE